MTVLLDNKTQPWPHEPKREVGRADRDTIDLLREILRYLPQLRVDILDGLTARITERLSQLELDITSEREEPCI